MSLKQPWSAEGQNVVLREDQALERFPCVENIARGAPHIRARGADPFVGVVRAPAAAAEEDIPAAVCQSEAHAAVEKLPFRRRGAETVIVFEKIYPPFRKRRRVDKFVVVAGGIARARHRAAAGIHAEFKAFFMYVIRDVFHAVGEFFGIGDEFSVFVPFPQGPAVVDDDVFVASVFETRFY